jgi:hypothetical protein
LDVGRRALLWSLSLPLAAAGVLVGHALAYALTGAPTGDVHAYLGHLPQVTLVLATAGLLGLAVQQRGGRESPAPYAAVGILGFVGMEHLERLVHTGQLPWLLTDRTFLVGLVLQVPVAAAILALARAVLRAVRSAGTSSPPRLSRLLLPLQAPVAAVPASATLVARRGRAPPPSL